MVQNRMGNLPQEEIEKQWEVVGLYCVFIFKKVGDGPGAIINERHDRNERDRDGRDFRERDSKDFYRSSSRGGGYSRNGGRERNDSRRRQKPNFGNFKLFRSVIDRKNWD